MVMKKYRCIVCGWVYDEYLSTSKEGAELGQKWENIPEDWVCPDCGASKSEFEIVKI
ncbi:rubredoxin [Candidatus Vesicomyidisocius calyptogenae]|uniref:Rubredoxin n=2 Tax=Vesicomyosocius okutanii subsp. Calyptogena okutanii (strain HA) TaxID=412965 RepID=A5CXT9_VESOH|nr:rubredoxin [Candidatus Vesicomyosocius okutanii]